MKVWIDDGCTACRNCEDICPDVFLVDEVCSVVEENVPGNEDAVYEAAEECPVEVIIIEEEDEKYDYDEDESDDDKDENDEEEEVI